MSKGEKTRGAITVGITCFITFYIIGNFPDATLAYFMTEIGASLELSVQQMTAMSSAGVLGLVVTVLFVSPLLDKFSTRKVMLIFCLIAAASIFGRALAPNYVSLYVCLFLTGAAAGVHYSGVNKAVGLWFEKKWLLTANAALIAAAALGYITALNTCGFVEALVGSWQNYYLALGALMVIIALLWILIVPERSSKDAALNQDVGVIDVENTSALTNCKYILKSPKVWCCLVGEMGFGTSITILIYYTSTSLQMAWGLAPQTAGTLQSFANIGSLFGYFIIPWAIGKIMGEKDTSLLAGVLMCVTLALWIYAYLACEGQHVLFSICFALGGFFNGLSYAAPRTYLMEQPEVGGLRSGTAIGILTFMASAVSFLATLGAGALFAVMPGKETWGMAILMCCGFVGAIAMFILYALNRKNARKIEAVS